MQETKERSKVSDTKDEDKLLHVFCTWCKRADRQHARKPSPFCGKQKIGPWKDPTGMDGLICQMCTLIANEGPCSRCGNRSII